MNLEVANDTSSRFVVFVQECDCRMSYVMVSVAGLVTFHSIDVGAIQAAASSRCWCEHSVRHISLCFSTSIYLLRPHLASLDYDADHRGCGPRRESAWVLVLMLLSCRQLMLVCTSTALGASCLDQYRGD